MQHEIEMIVPNLGDFSDVEIIGVLVGPGDEVAIEEPLITLETDKASMDVPSTHTGTVIALRVKVGDKVNAGDVILTLEAADLFEAEPTVVLKPDIQEALLAEATATHEIAQLETPEMTTPHEESEEPESEATAIHEASSKPVTEATATHKIAQVAPPEATAIQEASDKS